MCCRLRLDLRGLDEPEGTGEAGRRALRRQPLTGSIGVVTINMPRLGYVSRGRRRVSPEARRAHGARPDCAGDQAKVLERFTENNLYPYTKHYLRGVRERFGQYWKNHFSTIGLVGLERGVREPAGHAMSARRRASFSRCASWTSCGRSSSHSRSRRETTTTSRPPRPKAPRIAWRGSTRKSSPASNRAAHGRDDSTEAPSRFPSTRTPPSCRSSIPTTSSRCSICRMSSRPSTPAARWCTSSSERRSPIPRT